MTEEMTDFGKSGEVQNAAVSSCQREHAVVATAEDAVVSSAVEQSLAAPV